MGRKKVNPMGEVALVKPFAHTYFVSYDTQLPSAGTKKVSLLFNAITHSLYNSPSSLIQSTISIHLF